MQALGGGKPSDLLHEITKLCPTGYEKNPFFRFLFLQRLPEELRIILGDVEDHGDVPWRPRRISCARSLYNQQRHGLVAPVDPPTSSSQPSATVAEVKTGLGRRQRAATLVVSAATAARGVLLLLLRARFRLLRLR